MTRHFLSLLDFTSDELKALIDRAVVLKTEYKSGRNHELLQRKVLALIFEKSSTRTRVSFEVAMSQLGGSAIFLSPKDSQLGRGEPIRDTARVLSSMVDAISVRTFEHEKLERFAQYSTVPIINALSDNYHPCQLLADIMTYVEHRGSIYGKKVAWVGDGNNMCHSYINAAKQFGFNLYIASPKGHEPNLSLFTTNILKKVTLCKTPKEAVQNADLVVTDVWASMGQESEQADRIKHFKDYQINEAIMKQATHNALFMHCLPAHRGEEVTEEVLEGQQSVVWDEAENRLHAQKALLDFLLNANQLSE